MTINVAFTLIGGKGWTGGYNYLLNLLQALTEEVPGKIAAILLAGTDVSDAELQPFRAIPGCTCIQIDSMANGRRLRSTLTSLVRGHDPQVLKVLRSQKVDVVFEAATFFGWRIGRPVIAWIPDFQHKVLPHYFPKTAWWKRELGYWLQLITGRAVMLSSDDARSTFAEQYPAFSKRARVVRFAVAQAKPSAVDARGIADRYGLPERYFFMPNQYWAHKNHGLVIEALALLRKDGHIATVMATGRQLDPRAPTYVESIKAAVRDAGLTDQFLMPGLIPYEDLMPLMTASDALINPSLFEGWSTTVEEARSLGVPMILSDLSVHREQAQQDALYFDRHSARSLADVLKAFSPLLAAEKEKRRKVAREATKSRRREFASSFVALIEEALQG